MSPVVVVVGRPEQRCGRATAARRSTVPPPPARSPRRRAAGRRARRVTCVPRLGAILGTSASEWSSSGPDPVGPHAGRVDHVVGADRELLAGLGVAHLYARLREPSSLQQLDHLEPVGADRAEPLGLAEHGQHEPRVVGLAVVEQVAAGRVAVARARAAARRPPRRRSSGAGRGSSRLVASPGSRRRARPRSARRRHHVVHVQADAGQPVRPRAVERRRPRAAAA